LFYFNSSRDAVWWLWPLPMLGKSRIHLWDWSVCRVHSITPDDNVIMKIIVGKKYLHFNVEPWYTLPSQNFIFNRIKGFSLWAVKSTHTHTHTHTHTYIYI
jgi:hypothetical protein